MTAVLIILLFIYCSYIIVKRYRDIKKGKYCTGSCGGCNRSCRKKEKD